MCNLEVALFNIDMFVDIVRDDFYNIKYFYAYGEQNRATKERKTKTKSKAASAQGSSTLQQQLAVDDTPF